MTSRSQRKPRSSGSARWIALLALASSYACRSEPATRPHDAHVVAQPEPAPSGSRPRASTAGQDSERAQMVDSQLSARGIRDARVLAAMRSVPRHEFVPESQRAFAYEDHPLPIGYEQTISQPYIVAIMSELAALTPEDKVLEIGTGSGYQAAVLAQLAREVYSIEIVAPLAERAKQTLDRLGFQNVHVRAGDGYRGWPDQAPFAAILVTAAPPEVPAPLKEQLALGGRLVIPVGTADQELRVITRTEHGFEERTVLPVRFVPMTGKAQER